MADRGGPLVLSLDIGTSSCRAAFFDRTGTRASAARRVAVRPWLTPDGGAEIDAEGLFAAIADLIDRIAGRVPGAFRRVGAVATSAFWHSLIGLDVAERPITPVYLWLDRRAGADAAGLRDRFAAEAVHARTGCVFHSSYWPAKLAWLRRTRPALAGAVRRWIGFGEYLALRLFGRPAAGLSMASGTGLFNPNAQTWDAATLAAVGVDPVELPPVLAPGEVLTGLRPEFAERWPALRSIPWLPAVGDGACSNVGAGCTSRDRAALMIGTSGALRVLFRASDVSVPPDLWCYRADHRRFVLGGAIDDGGSLIAWLQRTLRLPGWRQTEAAVAALAPDGHGLTVVPAWGGERSPGWREDARGGIVGCRLATTPAEIVRAALEAVALRFAAIETILRPAVPEVAEIVVTGGAALRSPAWQQVLADAIGRPVVASAEPEGSSRGAALLALETLGWLDRPLEDLPPPTGPRSMPRPAITERYRAAAERQSRIEAAIRQVTTERPAEPAPAGRG